MEEGRREVGEGRREGGEGEERGGRKREGGDKILMEFGHYNDTVLNPLNNYKKRVISHNYLASRVFALPLYQE